MYIYCIYIHTHTDVDTLCLYVIVYRTFILMLMIADVELPNGWLQANAQLQQASNRAAEAALSHETIRVHPEKKPVGLVGSVC